MTLSPRGNYLISIITAIFYEILLEVRIVLIVISLKEFMDYLQKHGLRKPPAAIVMDTIRGIIHATADDDPKLLKDVLDTFFEYVTDEGKVKISKKLKQEISMKLARLCATIVTVVRTVTGDLQLDEETEKMMN